MKINLIISTTFLLSSLSFSQTATPPAAGDGSEGNPYQIATLDNLYWLSQTHTEWDKHYIQTADIDASSTNTWDDGKGFIPIGPKEEPQIQTTWLFTGRYNGQNHTIDGLFINRPSDYLIGLFGRIYNATIENLNVYNANIIGHGTVGALIGLSDPGFESSTFNNCYSSGTVSGSVRIGGLAGSVQFNASIKNSHSDCDVSGEYSVGGLIGSNGGTVTGSYSTGTVTGTVWYIGGLVGENSGEINNCYTRSEVNGAHQLTGGLVGYNSNGNITNCYSTGTVNNGSGFIGYNQGTESNNFWDIESSGATSSDGGTGKTTTEMKDIATFTDLNTDGLTTAWDFEKDLNDDNSNEQIWDMDNSVGKISSSAYIENFNDGYPFLSWQNGNDIALLGVENEQDDYGILESFVVLPAYPNPFNPSTTISYSIPDDVKSSVNINIFDLTGNLIAILQNTDPTVGWHSITWNGTNSNGEEVPAGIYFSRIIYGNEVRTNKLMLVK